MVYAVSDRGDYSTIIVIAGRNAFDAFAADAAVQKHLIPTTTKLVRLLWITV